MSPKSDVPGTQTNLQSLLHTTESLHFHLEALAFTQNPGHHPLTFDDFPFIPGGTPQVGVT